MLTLAATSLCVCVCVCGGVGDRIGSGFQEEKKPECVHRQTRPFVIPPQRQGYPCRGVR